MVVTKRKASIKSINFSMILLAIATPRSPGTDISHGNNSKVIPKNIGHTLKDGIDLIGNG